MQVDSALEAFDAVREAFSSATIIIISHSVGAWISLQVSAVQQLAFHVQLTSRSDHQVQK
jgi:esterase/lipase superfamily enzyme